MPISRLIVSVAVVSGLGLVALLAWPTAPVDSEIEPARRAPPVVPPRVETPEETLEEEPSPHQTEQVEAAIHKAHIRTALQASAKRAVGPVRFGHGPLSLHGNRPVLLQRTTEGCFGVDLDSLPGGDNQSFGRITGMGLKPRRDRGKRKPRARVKPGKPTISNPLEASSIDYVVRARARGVRFCYEKGLQRDPTLTGTLVIGWTIQGDGSVRKVRLVEDELAIDDVGRCIERVIKRWKFSKPGDGKTVRVTYPLTFRPPKAPKK